MDAETGPVDPSASRRSSSSGLCTIAGGQHQRDKTVHFLWKTVRSPLTYKSAPLRVYEHGCTSLSMNVFASVSIHCMPVCASLYVFFSGTRIVSLVGAASSTIFVVTDTCLSQQNTSFVATKLNDKYAFVMTKELLRQPYFCCDKKMCFVMTNRFVTTKVCLSQQNFCHNKNFVATSILLSQQKTCFVATNRCLSWKTGVCHDKTFVMTKMILVAALTKDRTAPP